MNVGYTSLEVSNCFGVGSKREINTGQPVNVRDKEALLRRLMDECAGGGRLSLEGDLSKCRFTEDQVLARQELGLLKRNTLWPKLDFIVLRLEPDTVAPIFKQIVAAGLSRAIVHVQIEHGGTLQLGPMITSISNASSPAQPSMSSCSPI